MLLHILLQSGINHDYDAQCPNPERNALRLINSTATQLIDGLCTSYRDTRRSGDAMLIIDPTGVGSRAAAALRRLGPLRHLQLEGLDDDALATVLAEAGRSASRSPSPGSPVQCRGLETLCLQRGVFSGTCLYTCHPDLTDALPTRSPLTGDASLAATLSLPAGLAAPSRLLPRLLELDLGGCGQLTDAGLEALTAEAPLLARLRITVSFPSVPALLVICEGECAQSLTRHRVLLATLLSGERAAATPEALLSVAALRNARYLRQPRRRRREFAMPRRSLAARAQPVALLIARQSSHSRAVPRDTQPVRVP